MKSCKKRRKNQNSWRYILSWCLLNHGLGLLHQNKKSTSTWIMDPTRSHEMPSCSAIDLAEIRRSCKMSSWIWSIISGVVTVLGRPGRGASQVEKITTFEYGLPSFWRWHTMVHVPIMFLSEWLEFPRPLALQKKKNLMTARVSMFLKSHASPDMLLFNLCNKKRLAIRHMNRPLFPTTRSIPSYDIGK